MPEIETAHKSSDSMVKSVGRSALGILGSRLSGIVRDVVIAGYWGGSGAAQAAYHLAFKVPNMFRSLFGEGSFSSAMVPALAEKLSAGDKEGAWRVAERTISLQMMLLAGLVAIGAFASFIISLLLPTGTREHISLTFKILPILLPYTLLVCSTASFAAVLNALRVFALPSLNQAVFNGVQVAAVLIIRCFWRNDEWYALFWFCASVIFAGFLQVGMLMWVCSRKGFRFHFRPVWRDDDVQKVCKRFVPSLIGSGTGILNQFLDSVLVASLGSLAVGALEYSHRLIYLPTGLLGVTMGSVCLTDMSHCSAQKDFRAMSEKLDLSLRLVMFLSIPCAVLMMVLATPIMALLFRHGNFNDDALRHSVFALVFYLPAVPAYCMQKVATTPHHASMDTKTPMRISLFCVGLNLVLNLSLMPFLREGGLALSTSICSWVNVILLLTLAKRNCVSEWRALRTFSGGAAMVAAAVVSGVAAFYVCKIIPQLFSDETLTGIKLNRLLQVLVPGIAGMAVYMMLCVAMRRSEVGEIMGVFSRRKKR